MTLQLPARFIGAAVVRRGSVTPCRRLRPIVVARSAAASDALVVARAEATNGCRRHQRQFSTAVRTMEYPSDGDDDDEAMDGGGGGDGTRAGQGMPRLQALRERLRTEEREGVRSGVRIEQQQQQQQQQQQIARTPIADSAETPTSSSSFHRDTITEDVDVAGKQILTDTHGRRHNYLRISLSERCNLRCRYCMPPEGVPLSPKSHLLTDGEIMRLVRLFARNGVDKVRLTGGEPLLRPNLAGLVRSISEALATTTDSAIDAKSSDGLVGITTNGLTLSRQIDDLVDAGLTGVNVSLDTLRPDRFLEITRRDGSERVMGAIADAVRAFKTRYGSARTGPGGTGGSRVKINCVVMKGFNDDELSDFVRAADGTFGGDVDVRFIEWMPFNDNGWNTSRFVGYGDMIDAMSRGGTPVERIGDGPNDTTKWYAAAADGRGARIGFITSMSEHFCSTCNRLRITADGKIKVCLFGSNEKEVSLRDIMRSTGNRRRQLDDDGQQGGDDDVEEEELSKVIYAAVQRKTYALGGHGNAEGIAEAADNRPMTLIGG